jgi:hypothetical protein
LLQEQNSNAIVSARNEYSLIVCLSIGESCQALLTKAAPGGDMAPHHSFTLRSEPKKKSILHTYRLPISKIKTAALMLVLCLLIFTPAFASAAACNLVSS